MCVDGIRVRGPGCAAQPEIADLESGAWAYEVPVAGIKDNKTMLLVRPASILRGETVAWGTGRTSVVMEQAEELSHVVKH